MPFRPCEPRLRALALAIPMAFASLPLLPASSFAAEQAQHYDIPAGTLSSRLNQLAGVAGIYLAGDASLTSGKQSPSLQGHYTVDQALSILLTGSGLAAVKIGEGRYELRALPSGAGVELAPMTVSGMSYGATTEGTGSYTQSGPTGAATGLNLTLRETPQSVTVMTRQRMDDFRLETLTDVMQQTPGVTVTRQADWTSFNVRGNRVNLQVDGNRQYSTGWGWNSHLMYSMDDMADIDRIEVLKGSSGLMTGDGLYGGTVNLIRKRPTHVFQANVRGSAGSWDTYRTEADVSGPLTADGSLRGRMVAAYKDGNSFRDNRKNDNSLFYGTLEYDLTPDTVLSVGASYKQREARGTVGTTPIQGYDRNGNAMPRMSRSFNGGASWAGYEQDSLNLFVRIEHSFDNGWSAKLQVVNERIETPEMLMGMLGYADSGEADYGIYKDIEDRNESVSLDVQGPFQLFGREHDLLIGVGQSKNRTNLLRGTGYSVALGDIGIDYAQGGGNIPKIDWSTLSYSDDMFSRKRRYAYSAARFNLADPVKLIVGVRATDYEQKDVSDISWYNYDMQETGVVTPYAGLVVDATSNISLYASYASIFEAQSNRDTNGSPLPPKEGLTYEIGAKGEFFDKRLNVSIAQFWMRVDNEAEQVGQNSMGESTYRAVAGAMRHGYEVELSGELASGWQAQGSYVMNSSNLESSTNMPRHQFKLGNTYTFADGSLDGLTIGAATRWQSDIHVARTGARLEQDAYWLFDLMSRYQLTERLSINANVNNLFDKKYYGGVSNFTQGLFYTWGEPRSLTVGARYDF